MRRTLKVIMAIAGSAILAMLALPAFLGFFGVQFLVVTTPSMAPTYPVNSIIIATPKTGDDLRLGEPIVFRHGDEGLPVTHRVVALEDGVATTRGDANDFDDTAPVTEDEVVARVHSSIDGPASAAFLWMQTLLGRVSLFALAFLLLYPALFGREKPAHPTSSSSSTSDSPALEPTRKETTP